MKTDYIRARIEPELKEHVHHIFDKLGLTPTQAIVMFYKSVEREHGIPFSLKIPNNTTLSAMENIEKGQYEITSLDELRAQWDD